MYDAIVVGARCAGSATAMLLVRKGYRVLLVDRVGFPSDTLSSHYIHQPGMASLGRWGLLDKVAGGCPPINRYVLDVGPFALRGAPPPADGQASAYAPRRTVLDKVLVDAAVEAGVELREHFSITELVVDGDRIAGTRGRSASGATVTDRARLVIGADGRHSFVARTVEAPLYNQRPAFSCAYYTYWSGVPVEAVELYLRPERMIITAPTNDGLTITIAYWPEALFGELRSDPERHFLETLDIVPELSERVRDGERAERFRGSAQLEGYFRRPYGPGWALVGDAAFHKNPITAEGITDAFRDAELLAGVLDDAFSGRADEQEALAGYEGRRNAASLPLYEMTADFAKLEPPPPHMQELLTALTTDQEQTNRFLGTIAGTVAIPDFFSPENLGAIMTGASV